MRGISIKQLEKLIKEIQDVKDELKKAEDRIKVLEDFARRIRYRFPGGLYLFWGPDDYPEGYWDE